MSDVVSSREADKAIILLETGLFKIRGSFNPNSSYSYILILIDTNFTYYVWPDLWLEASADGGYIPRDIEYVIENIPEDIQTALLFNLELFR